jgi:lysozyme
VTTGFLAESIAMLTRNEGSRRRMYHDSLGIPTIGVGLNLRRPDAKELLAAVGADYERVMEGNAISDQQIEQLLVREIEECLADLRVLVPGFDRYPHDARLVLLDMRFNLGPNRLREFKYTLADIRAGKYASAAARIEKTPYARQVGPRAVRNCDKLKALGDVA